MKNVKSIFWTIVIALAFVYGLRNFLAGMAIALFVPIDRLLFISHDISPVAMWAILGLLLGIIYGTFVAIKKFKLDIKLIVIPVGMLVLMINLILLLSYINKKWFDKPDDLSSEKVTEFNQLLEKGMDAVEKEKYELAQHLFEKARIVISVSPRIDSLSQIYKRTADDRCEQFSSAHENDLKYIPNNYYKCVAALKGDLTPERCK